MFDLRKLLEAGIAEVNQFDNGKSWNSVYAQKKQQPTQNRFTQPAQSRQQASLPPGIGRQQQQQQQQRQQTQRPQAKQLGFYSSGARISPTYVSNLNKQLDKGASFENASDQTGLGVEEIREYVNATRPNYGVKDFNLVNDTKKFVGNMADAVADIVQKPVTTLAPTKDRENAYQALRGAYNRGDITQQKFNEGTASLAKDFIGKKVVTSDKGFATVKDQNPLDFTKSFADAGYNAASVFPVARGAQIAANTGRSAFKPLAKEAVAWGTTDTLNDAVQGRLSPEQTLMNYAVNAALPGAGYVAGRAVRAAPQAAEVANNARPSVIAKQQARSHPSVLGFDDQYSQLQQKWQNTPDPVARRSFSMAMAENRQQRLQAMRQVEQGYLQGGYAQIPGKAPDPLEAPQVGKTDGLRDVPIADFKNTDTTSWNEAIQNVNKGELSKTNGPVEVVLTKNGYKLVEGNHRAVQALNNGDTTIKAKIISKEGLDEIAKRDGPHIKMGMQDSYTQKQLDAHFSTPAPQVGKTETLDKDVTLYHGSRDKIDTFDLNHLNATYMHDGLGINFTDSKDFAKLYSRGKNQWGEINKFDDGKGFINEKTIPKGTKVLDVSDKSRKVADILSIDDFKSLAKKGRDKEFARKNLERNARNILTGRDDSSLVIAKKVSSMSDDELLDVAYNRLKDRTFANGEGLPDVFRQLIDVYGIKTDDIADVTRQFSKQTGIDVIKTKKADGSSVYTVLNPDKLNAKPTVTPQVGKTPVEQTPIPRHIEDYAQSVNSPKDIVNETANYAYSQAKQNKGGKLLKNEGFNGEGDTYARISEHDQFYRDFYKQLKRAPSKADYADEVQRQLDTGGGSLVDPEQVKAYQLVKQREADTQAANNLIPELSTPASERLAQMAGNTKKIVDISQRSTRGSELPVTQVKQFDDLVVKKNLKTGERQSFSEDITGAQTKPNNLPVNFAPKSQVRNLDKITRSTRSIIERQGESGKVLADKLQGWRDTEELYQADIVKRIPTVLKLKGKEFENFVESTQNKADPMSEKVVQAIGEWRATHPSIRQRAVDAGLDVGDLGESYYPHFIDYDAVFKNKNTYNQAINHLVESGQATSQEEAIKLLGYARDVSRNRSFGNLEASRVIDLPMYDKTSNSLKSYIQSAARRTAQVETFGKDDGEALKLIAKAGSQGYDTEAMKNAYDIAVGAKKYNRATEEASRKIRQYTTTTRLGLGALTNTSQNVNTGIVTGHLRTLGAMVKQLSPEQRSYVADTGTIADAVLQDIRRSGAGIEKFMGQNAFSKTIDKITAPGFGAVERFNRSVASVAGRDYALRLAQKGDTETLRKLGVKGDIVGNTLTKEQQIQASRKVVEITQFKVDPQDLPGWVDSPGGKLVAQFRTFSYNQGKFFSNQIVKPAAKGNLMPLGRLLAAIPLGYGLYETRRLIDGRPEETDKTKVALQSFGKVGGAGLVLDLYNGLNPVGSKYLPPDRRTAMAVGTLGGPTAGTIANFVGGLSEAIQRKNIPDSNPDLEGKVAIKGDGDYTDLTSISRFGLQQIPIVGTATANRVLPYKKQSEADQGKNLATTGGQDAAAIKEAAKARNVSLKKSLSADDYELYQLSAADKQKLVDSGAITQEKVDGLMNYVDQKKQELGYDTTAKTYAEKFKEATADYKRNKDKMSPIERVKKEKDLKYLAVQKDYDNDTVGLYGMNKGDVYDLVSNDKNGKKYVDQILAYGDALVSAGLSKTNKFRDKYGNVLLSSADKKTSSSGGSKKKSSGGSKASALKFPSTDPSYKATSDTYKTLSRLLAGTVAKTSKPKQIGRKVALKKITVRS